jgi:xylulokinase
LDDFSLRGQEFTMSTDGICLRPESLITGWDFSTGSVKCLAFDLQGDRIAEFRLSTDLWTKGGVSELNLPQLEGQVHATVRAIAASLRDMGRLDDWVAGGISATHHTAGRIDALGNQVRRAICWNDPSLARYHAVGLQRLGGPQRPLELIGGPWAIRYTLSHLVKDERKLKRDDWYRTKWIVQHGSLAAGYLTGRFDLVSISSAASTGLMDLRTNQWRREMLAALKSPKYRELAAQQLPQIVNDTTSPLGPLAEHLAVEAGIKIDRRPLIFPTLDDQAAGLVGGGAVDAGQVAVILGNSAVVNSSASHLPQSGTLDAMKLNWDRYLWMRCYNNGAQFLDKVIGRNPKWDHLATAREAVPPGCGGVMVLPFVHAEPALGITKPTYRWLGPDTKDPVVRFRASLEAIACLIALAVREHVQAGQQITDITVSGGIARSDLMCEILATILERPLKRLQSDEGPALGAAVVALAGIETHLRRQQGRSDPFTVQQAVATLVKYRETVLPNPAWLDTYRQVLPQFESAIQEAVES